MRALTWLFNGFLFFTLFAFALNNLQSAVVHWFFGAQWSAPMVIVVLVAFAAGCVVGVLAMLPGWWRHRRAARTQTRSSHPTSGNEGAPARPGVGADAPQRNLL